MGQCNLDCPKDLKKFCEKHPDMVNYCAASNKARELTPDQVGEKVEELIAEIGEMRSEVWIWFWAKYKHVQSTKKFPGWLEAIKEMRKDAQLALLKEECLCNTCQNKDCDGMQAPYGGTAYTVVHCLGHVKP